MCSRRSKVAALSQRTQVESVVREEIRAFLADQGRDVGDISDRDVLSGELGLSSSQVAELVSRIGVSLQVSPRAHVRAVTDLVTVGDLVHAWHQALASDRADGGGDELQVILERARARRDGKSTR